MPIDIAGFFQNINFCFFESTEMGFNEDFTQDGNFLSNYPEWH